MSWLALGTLCEGDPRESETWHITKSKRKCAAWFLFAGFLADNLKYFSFIDSPAASLRSISRITRPSTIIKRRQRTAQLRVLRGPRFIAPPSGGFDPRIGDH
jgi:hypothetical protein